MTERNYLSRFFSKKKKKKKTLLLSSALSPMAVGALWARKTVGTKNKGKGNKQEPRARLQRFQGSR